MGDQWFFFYTKKSLDGLGSEIMGLQYKDNSLWEEGAEKALCWDGSLMGLSPSHSDHSCLWVDSTRVLSNAEQQQNEVVGKRLQV